MAEAPRATSTSVRPTCQRGDATWVSLRLKKPLTSKFVGKLRKQGASAVAPLGQLPLGKRTLSVQILCERLPRLRRLAEVETVEPAMPAERLLPMDKNVAESHASTAWFPPPPEIGTLGENIVIADYEYAWDPFHPDLFKPDGGLFDFVDTNNDLVAGAGDMLDLDADGEAESVLSLMEGPRVDYFSGQVLDSPAGYQPAVDWLYIDSNGNGQRDIGAEAAVDENTPALGEPIFVGDDVNQNAELNVGERLVRLKTSKVKAIVRQNSAGTTTSYTRGENLAEYMLFGTQDQIKHGTNSLGVLAGGWPGLRRYTGVAPGAELVLIDTTYDVVSAIAAAETLGAQVHVHQWSLLDGFHDGSSVIETAIRDSVSRSFVHVAPTGDFTGFDHNMQVPYATSTRSVRFTTSGRGQFQYGTFWLNLRWRGPLSEAPVTLLGMDGSSMDLHGAGTGTVFGMSVQVISRQESSRGTSWLQVQFFPAQGNVIPETELTLQIGRAPPSGVLGLLHDDQSGWGQGVGWIDDLTERGTALAPATADDVISVGAYVGGDGGNFTPGEIRKFSGRGPRIDGIQVPDVVATDNGVSVLSFGAGTTPGLYSALGGTSEAVAHAGGALALMRSHNPAMTPLEIKSALQMNARVDEQTGAVPNESFGYGKLNVAGALALGPGNETGMPPTLSISQQAEARVGKTVTLRALASDPDGDTSQLLYEWDVGYDRQYEVPASTAGQVVFKSDTKEIIPVVARVTDISGRTARVLYRVPFCDSSGCPEVIGQIPVGAIGSEGEIRGGCTCAVYSRTTDFMAGFWCMLFLSGFIYRRMRRET